MGSIAADQMSGSDSIYRKNGRLAALLRSNPKVNPADRVYVGTKIILPALSEIDLREPANEKSVLIQETTIQASSKTNPPSPTEVPAVAPAQEPTSQAEITNTNAVSEVGQRDTEPLVAEESYSPRFEVALGGSFVSLESRDRVSGSRATFASDFSPSVSISLLQPLSPAWSIFGRFEYRDLSFQQPTLQGTVQQPGSQKGLAAGALRESKGLRIGVEAGLKQSPFPRANGVNVYAFDRLTIPYTQVLLGLEPVHLGSSKLGIEGRYNYLGESNAGVQRARPGKALAAEVYWRHEFKNKRSYRLGLFYSTAAQDTNLTEQKQTQIGLGLNFVLPLGD